MIDTVSWYLAKGFSLSLDMIPDDEGTCAICGNTGGMVDLKKIIKPTTSDIANTFKNQHGVCFACAAVFSDSKLFTSNLYADEAGRGIKPMVAIASATEDRPAWRDIFRNLAPETKCVIIVTSNTKRRLWPSAVVSTVGAHLQVLFVDGNTERILTINHQTLLECLDSIEALLAAGYSKIAIASNVLQYAKQDIQSILQAMQAESQIKPIRDTDEFQLALFISQKED